jgi:hypothetical protein
VPSAALISVGNASLRPERQSEFEAGFDADFSKVKLEFTAYNRQSSDALINRPYGPSFGLGGTAVKQVNVGEVRNRGIEALVNLTLLSRRSVTWDVNLNGSINQNELLRLAPDVPRLASGIFRQTPGYPVNSMWDRKIRSWSDANNNGIIELNEVVLSDTAEYLGELQPPRQLGASSNVGLFGDRVRLSAMADYRGGHARWNNDFANRCFRTINSCREVNDPTTPLAQQAKSVAFNQPTGSVWTGYIEDGTFVRLREVGLTLSDPRMSRALRAQDAKLNLSARNLYTWTRYTGIDAEATNAPGRDQFADNPTLPPARYFVARLTLVF